MNLKKIFGVVMIIIELCSSRPGNEEDRTVQYGHTCIGKKKGTVMNENGGLKRLGRLQ